MIQLDKLIYMIDNISSDEFKKFKDGLDLLEMSGKLATVHQTIGKGAGEYHYQLNIGRGEGAIFIGWQHNGSKALRLAAGDVWSMKVEYNPNKIGEEQENAVRLLQSEFEERTKRITTLDFCYDVPVHPTHIFVFPKYAREENRYRGDRYYGLKSNNGHLKVYDKKRERKEKAGIEMDPDEELTRIEYTFKVPDGMFISRLEACNMSDLADEYIIRKFKWSDMNGLKPELRACMIAVLWGQMQVKEFGRATKANIKKALEQCEELPLGSLIQDSWESIINTIKKYVLNYG